MTAPDAIILIYAAAFITVAAWLIRNTRRELTALGRAEADAVIAEAERYLEEAAR